MEKSKIYQTTLNKNLFKFFIVILNKYFWFQFINKSLKNNFLFNIPEHPLKKKYFISFSQFYPLSDCKHFLPQIFQ